MPDETIHAAAGSAAAFASSAGRASAYAHASSATTANTKGPLVWLDMDQAELDAAYDQSQYAPNQEQVKRRRINNSEAAIRRLGPPKCFAYGSAPIEKLDVYTTKQTNAPINVFIHGGAWRSGAAREFAFPAEMFVNAGAHYVVLDFNAVHEVGGSLFPMADQVRRAVAWVYRNAETFGGDRDRLYVTGHSSGGHLAGVVLTTDWTEFGLKPDITKGGLCTSGMYDLKPVRLSARSSYVNFTDEMEEALSSQRHLDRLYGPIIVAHGTLETPEFQRQARDFAAAVEAAGKPVTLLVAEDYNHFEILETLGNPYGLLGRAVLEQMKLSNA
jgi:arylformamidase